MTKEFLANSSETDFLDAIVLAGQKTLFYDSFRSRYSLAKYALSSDDWHVIDGELVNSRIDESNSRLGFYADFPIGVTLESEFRVKDIIADGTLIFQLLTTANQGKSIADGYGVLINTDERNELAARLIQSQGGRINNLTGSVGFKLNANSWVRIRFVSHKKGLSIYINDNLLIKHDFSSLGRIFSGTKQTHGGIGIVKRHFDLAIKYIRIFLERTDGIIINNLRRDLEVELTDSDDKVVAQAKSDSTSVSLKVTEPTYGRLVIRDGQKIIARSLPDYVIGGDVYTYLRINLNVWIEESQRKLFSDTFWRQNSHFGGVLARLEQTRVFSESTEFAYFYHLHWKYLLDSSNDDFDRIMKIRTFVKHLREVNPVKSFGLFYEWTSVEDNRRVENSVRSIIQGTTGRFLAHFHVLTGDQGALDELKVLLDRMIELGIVNSDNGELKIFDPISGRLSEPDNNPFIEPDIKFSYIIDAYTLGYSLTGNVIYLSTAQKITDWLIANNLDPIYRCFKGASTHDTMEFLEAVWGVYLITGSKKYYDVIADNLRLYFHSRHRGKLIPFRHYNVNGESYSYDTLSAAQMFLAIKLAVWGEEELLEFNKNLLAYLYSIRHERAGDRFGAGSLRYYLRYLKFRLKGSYFGKGSWDKQYLWNFRYSAATNTEVRDWWLPDSNWMSFTLSYLLGNLHSVRYGALVSIFLGRYYFGRPYVAFTQAKIAEFRSDDNESSMSFHTNHDCFAKIVIPSFGPPHELYLDGVLVQKSKEPTSNPHGQILTITIKAPGAKLVVRKVDQG